jgi:hypothetical protein
MPNQPSRGLLVIGPQLDAPGHAALIELKRVQEAERHLLDASQGWWFGSSAMT